MAYVEGYIVPVPAAELDAYFVAAKAMAAIWKEHGALSVVEALADDAPYGEHTSFPRSVDLMDHEVVVFSYITYPDRATRDAANEKTHGDSRMADLLRDSAIDGKRMIWGGFQVRVSE